MDSAARIAVAHTALRQQDMIHAASAKDRVVHAHGDAGTQQRIQDDRDLTGRNLTDVKTYPFAGWRVESLCNRGAHHRCLRQIAPDS